MYDTASDWPNNPHALFQEWMAEAVDKEINNPNAMCVSTVDADGKPSSRMLLLKGHDENGFVFYTNEESRKGQNLAINKNVALCFYWKSMNRQVRIEGTVSYVSDTESDAYFRSRHPHSRIGAWASHQSRPLKNREEFETRFAEFEAKYPNEDDIPRPPHWRGFRVTPTHIEFWIEELYRLHRRCAFTLDADKKWQKEMLYP